MRFIQNTQSKTKEKGTKNETNSNARNGYEFIEFKIVNNFLMLKNIRETI